MDPQREHELLIEKLTELVDRARALKAGEALGQLAAQLLALLRAEPSGSALPDSLVEAVGALLVERQQIDDEVRARLERLEAASGLSHPPGLPIVSLGRFGHERAQLVTRVSQLESWAQQQGSPYHSGGVAPPEQFLHPPSVAEMVHEERRPMADLDSALQTSVPPLPCPPANEDEALPEPTPPPVFTFPADEATETT